VFIVFIPKNEGYAAAARVAAALDLPDGWLNDAVKGFLLGPDRFPTKTLEMPGLRCEVASLAGVRDPRPVKSHQVLDPECSSGLQHQRELASADLDGLHRLRRTAHQPRNLYPDHRHRPALTCWYAVTLARTRAVYSFTALGDLTGGSQPPEAVSISGEALDPVPQGHALLAG
jgi:hypothetical protein